jgi:hypothetical protein
MRRSLFIDQSPWFLGQSFDGTPKPSLGVRVHRKILNGKLLTS